MGLAQLGRDPRQAERGVDALLRLTGDALVVTHPEEAVLVQLESESKCAVAEGDVVRLGAGEVLHRRAAARGRHEAEIRLLAASQQHTRLGLAPAEHALDKAVGREPVHDGGRGADREHVEIAARFAAAPEAPDRDELHVGFLLPQQGHERRRCFGGVGHQVAAGMAPVIGQRLEHRLLLAGTHSADLADAAVLQRGFEIVERVDSQLRVQLAHGPRADALQPHQIEEGWRELGEQLPVVFRSAGLGDLAHLLREVAADAGDLQQAGSSRSARRSAARGHAVGGVTVRPDLERVLRLDLEQVGNLPEQACDREVIHGAGPCP